MYSSAYSDLILGVTFTYDEIYTVQETTTKTCHEHGVQDSNYKWCPYCARPLQACYNKVFSKGFSSLASRFGIKEKALLKNMEHHDDTCTCCGIWENGHSKIFGMEIGSSSSSTIFDESVIDLEAIETNRADLEIILTILGFHNKKIQLHLISEIC